MDNYSVVVLDFETTGLSPDCGDRTIEVGAVLISNNQIVDRFESLMNPGVRVSGFIEEIYRHHQQNARQCPLNCQ